MDNEKIRELISKIDDEETLRYLIDEASLKIKSRHDKREKKQTLSRATRVIKAAYKQRAGDSAPAFDSSKVTCTKSRSNDDGYTASFDNGYAQIYVHAYVTWRKGDYDLFTDVSGTIDGERFSDSD